MIDWLRMDVMVVGYECDVGGICWDQILDKTYSITDEKKNWNRNLPQATVVAVLFIEKFTVVEGKGSGCTTVKFFDDS